MDIKNSNSNYTLTEYESLRNSTEDRGIFGRKPICCSGV